MKDPGSLVITRHDVTSWRLAVRPPQPHGHRLSQPHRPSAAGRLGEALFQHPGALGVAAPVARSGRPMSSSAPGQARASSQAVVAGQLRSRPRPWISTPGDPGQPSGVADHGAVVEKSGMGEVVRAEPDERQQRSRRTGGSSSASGFAFGSKRQALRSPSTSPVRRGLVPHPRIWVFHQPRVRWRPRRRSPGLRGRAQRRVSEALPLLGEEPPRPEVQPVDLRTARRADRAEHDLRHAGCG